MLKSKFVSPLPLSAISFLSDETEQKETPQMSPVRGNATCSGSNKVGGTGKCTAGKHYKDI